MNKVVAFPGKGEARSKKEKRGGGGGGGAPPGERDALEAKVAEINTSHAFVLQGGRSFVLRELIHPTLHQPTQEFLTTTAFKDLFGIDRFYDAEQDRYTGLGHLWLKHKARRGYFGVTFNPEGAPDGWYNLWRGFTIEPAPATEDYRHHCRQFPTLTDHVLSNVAGGDKALAKWIWAWFAHMIQRPIERIGVALVLRGRQGSGKSALGDAVGMLLGPHYTLIDDPRHLVGNFNAHLASCLFLQADEAVWAGDKGAAGRLRSLITSSRTLQERKNIDAEQVRNLVRLLMTSEEDWVVPASKEERRFAVIDIGTGRMQDRAYFTALFSELKNGGLPHLLRFLMDFPLEEVSLNQLPRTEALFEQKAANFDTETEWWYNCLQQGAILSGHRKWAHEVPSAGLYASYLSFAERTKARRPFSNARLGIKLRQLIPLEYGFKPGKIKVEVDDVLPDGSRIPGRNGDGTPKTEWVNGYQMPGLTACRQHFCAMVRHDIKWPDDDVSGAPDCEKADSDAPF
ncbi:primase-helicase family protein [Paramagnetospirillum magneticum]|uniref:NrS-1 polymerase-like helicase domain-containing protein n=1 Tax=Paramagnetospirillum magneticum (strain ATCC 700264 / AMB-1) TaxID=342108 RepID=Q2W752_PARM1|nr:primase-helicase family protein [Paramagnetospirillum magneticum]BAE50323.1 hypothetical protein amb1519 [Paramagnetospirillum magneticum AMB-1]